MPVRQLQEFLDSQHVKYVTIRHSPAYTAQEIAASAHIPGKEVAKTVMVKIDGTMAMAVLPASHKVDFARLQEAAGAGTVELASEHEFKDRFPECDVGAMPPFGNLYGLPVFVAESLADDEEIAFNAGSHTELMRLAYSQRWCHSPHWSRDREAQGWPPGVSVNTGVGCAVRARWGSRSKQAHAVLGMTRVACGAPSHSFSPLFLRSTTTVRRSNRQT
jgi:Ala-tRNA(Pro) deacylase